MEEKIIYKAIIPGVLPGCNEYVLACRTNAMAAARMKKTTQQQCFTGLYKVPRGKIKRASFEFHWYEPNKRRDKDNIDFAKKFILDTMQNMRILPNDGWKNVGKLFSDFFVDKDNPRVEIIIMVEECI